MTTSILVTARLKSTRLPKKVLKPLCERPMMAHLLDRMKRVEGADEVVICTSPLEEDAPLFELAEAEGVACFAGDPQDVLQRLTDCAVARGADTVINCTADNPLVSTEHVDALIDFHEANDHDYSDTEGLPRGAFSYALKREAMVEACRIKADLDTEVWGRYFTETGRFRWGTLKFADESVRWPELRVTVDTPEDFALMERVFGALYKEGEVFSLKQVVAFCRENPDVLAINGHIGQWMGRPAKLKEGL